MRHRVALVLLSLLTVIALAAGGWFLDPAGSRSGVASPAAATLARRSTSGKAMFATLLTRMQAAGTTTYTFSGSSGGGETQSGAGAIRFLPSGQPAQEFDADVTLSAGYSGATRAVLLPGAFYLALPPARGLARDKPWLKVVAGSTSTLGVQMRPVAEQARAAVDPAQTLGLLRAAPIVQEVGPGTVDGARAVQYQATVDLRAAGLVTGDAVLRDQYHAMRAAGVRALDLRVWLDPLGRPVKVSVDVPATTGLFSVTGVYRGWGRPVAIVAPTASQVVDADTVKG